MNLNWQSIKSKQFGKNLQMRIKGQRSHSMKPILQKIKDINSVSEMSPNVWKKEVL